MNRIVAYAVASAIVLAVSSPVSADLSPKSPPVLRRVLGLMFGPKRPVFPVPDCWQIRWA